MQQQKLNVKLLGILIAIFSAFQMFSNLYIIILPHILKPNELEKLLQMLSRMFGPIVIQESMNIATLSIKAIFSALFLSSAIGMIKFKEWSRKLLFCLLGIRIIYGLKTCIISKILHPSFMLILVVSIFLFYYLTRPKVKEQFK